MKLRTFNDVLAMLLSNIHYIGTQAQILYPKMQVKTRSQEVKNVLEQHLIELRKEQIRIEKILKTIKAQKFDGFSTQSIFENAEKLLKDNEPSPLLDTAIITCIQQIEHLEASAYSSLEAFAETLNLEEITSFFEESLREINKIDDTLETLEKEQFYSPSKIT